jgi:hypothetical protein
MRIEIIQEGKEVGQGVGYLDDGTMIVVEEGRRYIGATLNVIVTKVLQTAAGRMIFARPDLTSGELIRYHRSGLRILPAAPPPASRKLTNSSSTSSAKLWTSSCPRNCLGHRLGFPAYRFAGLPAQCRWI